MLIACALCQHMGQVALGQWEGCVPGSELYSAEGTGADADGMCHSLHWSLGLELYSLYTEKPVR